MRSLYSRLFSYRQNEKLSPKETFLTEILGYCLESDEKFLSDFLRIANIKMCNEHLTVRTQGSYSTLGRPDIELISQNFHLIIECKVEANERTNQLLDYGKILQNSEKENIRLVYLTKYIESKEPILSNNQFITICWYDVAKIIVKENEYCTKELKNYLTELNMSDIRYFSAIDLAALTTLSSTIEKMDDTLNAVRTYYTTHLGNVSKNSARSTALKNRCYLNWQTYQRDKKTIFDIAFGYYWFFEEDVIPVVGVRIWIPTYGKDYKLNEYYQFFSKELKEWEVEEDDDGILVANYKYLSDFMTHTKNDEQLKEIIEFFKVDCIDEITRLKNKFPKFFMNHTISEEKQDLE